MTKEAKPATDRLVDRLRDIEPGHIRPDEKNALIARIDDDKRRVLRSKALENALINLLAAIEGGAPVAANTTDRWNARLAEARAALKEPANG